MFFSDKRMPCEGRVMQKENGHVKMETDLLIHSQGKKLQGFPLNTRRQKRKNSLLQVSEGAYSFLKLDFGLSTYSSVRQLIHVVLSLPFSGTLF
jgi:hypothetical protein